MVPFWSSASHIQTLFHQLDRSTRYSFWRRTTEKKLECINVVNAPHVHTYRVIIELRGESSKVTKSLSVVYGLIWNNGAIRAMMCMSREFRWRSISATNTTASPVSVCITYFQILHWINWGTKVCCRTARSCAGRTIRTFGTLGGLSILQQIYRLILIICAGRSLSNIYECV